MVNTGVDFRSENTIGNPAGKQGAADGLGIGTEWRWAVGAYLPLAGGKFRLGADIFGQTGLTNDDTVGNTIFTKQNTPIEYDVEGRMRLPRFAGSDKWYVGAGAGSLLAQGYGAPDLRIVGLFGTYWTFADTDAPSPEAREKLHVAIRESMKDTDGDGIPDDVDACPTEPEDHKDPDPGDGCPAPADRDGDGIPDQYDKCPDKPEDKDGVDDEDGCPEDDADNDGIPDAKDACPKVPGQPDPDPKKNGCPKFIQLEGSTVRVLQQVHFATGSATILPDSFPMLMEIVKLLQATPGIKKMRVEGHTDNRGSAAMNLDLSKRRAASVATWLIQHGIDSGRLSSEGYGITKPIDTNDTDAGRQANRRVEFKSSRKRATRPRPRWRPTSPPRQLRRMARAASVLASITPALALVAALQAACSSSSSSAGPGADGGGHGDATATDAARSPDANDVDASGAEAGGPADGGYSADGSCPAAELFFTASPPRAACASAHCCADFTTCLASPECVVLFQCTASCYQGSDASGQAALDPCITRCVGDAATVGANDYRTSVACLRSNCLADFTDASPD